MHQSKFATGLQKIVKRHSRAHDLRGRRRRVVDLVGLQTALANYVLAYGLAADLDAFFDNYWESFDPREAAANEPAGPACAVLDFTRSERSPR